MEHSTATRPLMRRYPLADTTTRANEVHYRREKPTVDATTSSPRPLPHNESLVPNGTLAVRHGPDCSPENKRISTIIQEDASGHNSKRDSEISNTSTNASGAGRRRKTHIGLWQLGRTIGRGGCSRVRIVRHSVSGQFGAAKIISKAMAEQVRALSLVNLIESAKQDPSMFPGGKVIPFGLEREIVIMKLLDHDNIVKLHDVWENRNELYLIMEYLQGGDLFGFIGEQGMLSEVHAVHLFRQIIVALLYCHRLNIHHRDLKPENILLDRDSMKIKLVDFGMAALQPVGKKLTTPCGSPHYAAPEVIRTKSYDGGKADVWSCGVILYVMLTGTPPFNYTGSESDLGQLFRAIAHADYVMPDTISRDAQDLIGRILVPDPKRRISMEGVFKHPFLHKFDAQFGFDEGMTTMEHWVGPDPTISEWEPLTVSTVDRTLLRNLRTLWHSEREEVIVQRLLDNEPNQEKYFYAALKKHTEDALENYLPHSSSVGYSHSDHHHYTKTVPTPADLLQLPSKKHKRTQSGYSILNNEHLYSKHSFYDPPSSEGSYDPFRASREPIIPGQSNINNGVEMEHGSDGGVHKMRPVTALGHRTGSSLRVQALRNSRRQSSGIISRGSSKRSTPSQRSLTTKQRSISRSSIASSHWPSSPPVAARPRGAIKRGVSFSHLKRPSVASGSISDLQRVQYTPTQCNGASRMREIHGSDNSSPPHEQPGSSVSPASNAAAPLLIPRIRFRKPDSDSKYLQGEIRKCSTDLADFMEEQFNGSSVGSSVRTSVADSAHEVTGFDTPPTSFSNRDSGGSTLTPVQKAILQNRPLPPLPVDTPNTNAHRELAELRAEIARTVGDGVENTIDLRDILKKIDGVLMRATVGPTRASSAPTRSPEHTGPLPMISEEVKTDSDDRPTLRGRRAVTEHTTIRLVDQSPTPAIAPLNIRKRSAASTTAHTAIVEAGTSGPRSGSVLQSDVRSYQAVQNTLNASRADADVSRVSVTVKHPEKEPVIKKKKSSWFRRSAEEKENQLGNVTQSKPAVRLQIPEAWQDLDDRIKHDHPTAVESSNVSKQTTKQSYASSEFPMRNQQLVAKAENSARKGFLGFFGKKNKEDKGKRPMELEAANFSSSTLLSGFDLEPEGDNPVRIPSFQTNWLARFLHIKPASKVLCFQAGRGKVRSELLRLLRSWHQHGVRDVSCDRASHAINARVDKVNRLQIKPVSIVIELFVVLSQGRRANLCVVRFTQTHGAASSFRKAVDIIEDCCQDMEILVQDEKQKAEMCSVLKVG
ncbi:serine/threonine-protein kinase-like protein GIN4 [Polyplosphaeria fusca]|uniref:non-specific serine/threonine protein kinase n=1 Tax=Polyplosphaeria fusca TaxID=682080 RepID=A0A9P4V6N1_9PLEO|nr:serine/threonine-protein kinase-like protein GIN4 [Polyplosphaeria fusca]